MYKRILYPIKFEEFSLDLLSCVLSFKDAGTREVVLLYVIDVEKLPMDRYEGYSPEEVERITGIAERKMEAAGFKDVLGEEEDVVYEMPVDPDLLRFLARFPLEQQRYLLGLLKGMEHEAAVEVA